MMNKEEILGAFLLVNNPIVLSEEEVKDVQEAIVQLQQENKQLKEEIKQYQKELEKADSITQSCIFQGEKESKISFRNCLNKMTEYKTRIDKAIEHTSLKKMRYVNEQDYLINVCDLEELLEILKGE